jgi:hypothetical protein
MHMIKDPNSQFCFCAIRRQCRLLRSCTQTACAHACGRSHLNVWLTQVCRHSCKQAACAPLHWTVHCPGMLR